ncbi:MAG: hypothetical protein HYX52_06310 [Chloroflexi bacterium]|nr:hypothetical protein [Chloroflexota bacterium]
MLDNLIAINPPRPIVFEGLFSEPTHADDTLAAAFQRARARQSRAPAGIAPIISSGAGPASRRLARLWRRC